MSTVNDVAKAAGVSKSTVSYVFSGKKHVGIEIKERVLKACEKLNYTPNFFAANILSNKSGIVGLFFEPDNANWYPFYNTLLSACIIEFQKKQMHVIPYFNAKDKEIADLLLGSRTPIMGAIILTPRILDERIETFGEKHLPFVLIGEPEEKIPNLQNVDVNNTALTREIFEYICARGHKNILFCNAPKSLTISKFREKSLAEFLEKNPQINVKIVNIEDEEGKARDAFLAAGGFDFSCIVTASDIMARDIYNICSEKNVTVGKELSVIAFGGEDDVLLHPRLTMARQSYFEIAGEAVKLLCNLLEKGGPLATNTILVKSSISEGESVCDLNKA